MGKFVRKMGNNWRKLNVTRFKFETLYGSFLIYLPYKFSN